MLNAAHHGVTSTAPGWVTGITVAAEQERWSACCGTVQASMALGSVPQSVMGGTGVLIRQPRVVRKQAGLMTERAVSRHINDRRWDSRRENSA